MRARNLKPSFFVNDQLAAVEPLGRLLFQGLWCMADRAGRLEDRPLKIKASVLPFDNCDVENLLNSLVKNGFILRYEKLSKLYIQIINFTKHQFPHVKESESTIPAPGKHQTSLVQNRLNPESPFLNPESPFPVCASRTNTVQAQRIQEERREYRIPEPKEDPTGALVMYYKAVKKSIPYDDRTWDRKHWPRSAKAAADVLKVCGSYEAARACLDQIVTDMGDRSWTLETVTRWAHEWKAKQGGKDYGATNSQRFFSAVAQQRSKAKFENLRKISTAGEILDGVRDIPMLPSQTGGDHGTAGKSDGGSLARVRETALEATPDRGQTS